MSFELSFDPAGAWALVKFKDHGGVSSCGGFGLPDKGSKGRCESAEG